MSDPNFESTGLQHQGGIRPIPVKWEYPVVGSTARSPIYQNDTGGKAGGESPHGVKLPKLRRIEASKEFWLPSWARDLVERNATPEAMVREALKRVSNQHSEKRLLEAQAVINELGRSAEHTKVLRSVLTKETIKSFLSARR
jgi:hypothetical protein